MSVALFLLFVFTRNFAMGVQDRAIRAEENLRHFALTGKRLDPRLTIKQIVGLRFASDAEFVELARKAAEGVCRRTDQEVRQELASRSRPRLTHS